MFDWDDSNRRHVAEHGVTAEEAEQVVANEPMDLTLNTRNGEERIVQVCETDMGRVLVVVTTWRGERIRVVTAYPANRQMRELYMRQKGSSHGGGVQGS